MRQTACMTQTYYNIIQINLLANSKPSLQDFKGVVRGIK